MMMNKLGSLLLMVGALSACSHSQPSIEEPSGTQAALAAPTQTSAPSPREDVFLAVYGPGPNWVQGKPLTGQDIQEHSRHMGTYSQQGVVIAGGPVDDTHGVYIVRTASQQSASQILASDPGVTSGLLKPELHSWQVMMNQFRGSEQGGGLYFLDYVPGPQWAPNRSLLEQNLASHMEYVQKQFGAGKLVVGGPLRGEDRGMYLIAAGSEADAQKFVAEDPAVRDGLFAPRVLPWNVMFANAL